MKELILPHDHGQTMLEEQLINQIADIDSFSEIADTFKLLGDSSRLRIFWLLCHCEECVLNISAIMEMSSPAVSHHLKQLKAGGLITSRREGKEVYYKAADIPKSTLLHTAIESIMEISCPRLYRSEHVETIHQIHDYLLQNLDKRITIEELSNKFLMNSTTIKNVFKGVYGNSLAAHMKEHRLEHAATLLANTALSISHIAEAVGYSSQSKFTEAFREFYGLLPSEYRKSL